jgi:hypothetical protein
MLGGEELRGWAGLVRSEGRREQEGRRGQEGRSVGQESDEQQTGRWTQSA